MSIGDDSRIEDDQGDRVYAASGHTRPRPSPDFSPNRSTPTSRSTDALRMLVAGVGGTLSPQCAFCKWGHRWDIVGAMSAYERWQARGGDGWLTG